MKRKSLVQSNNNRRLVSLEPGSGQHSLTGAQQSMWAGPTPGQGNADQPRTQSSLTTTALGTQNSRE
ncbi:hypothetical protein ABIB26_000912 [Arthrobacter sp. UYEF20]